MNTTQLVLSAKQVQLIKGELLDLLRVTREEGDDLAYVQRIAQASAECILGLLDRLQSTQKEPDPLNPVNTYLQLAGQKLFNIHLEALLDTGKFHEQVCVNQAIYWTNKDLQDVADDKPKAYLSRERRTVHRSPSPSAHAKIQSILNS